MAATYQPPQWLVPNMGPGNVNKVGNYSFGFDGVDDEVIISNPGATIWGYGETTWSISLWMNADAFSDQDGLVCRRLDTNNRIAIKLDTNSVGNDGLMFLVNVAGTLAYVEWNNLFTAGTWYNVCVTYDSGTVKTYIDGVDQGGADVTYGTIPATIPNLSGADIDIGNDVQLAGRFYNGYMSEVCVFDYVLDSDQINHLYGSAAAGVRNPMELDVVPVAYYKGDRAAFGDEWAVPNQGVPHNYALAFSSDYVTTPPWNGYQGIRASSTAVSSSHITLSCWFRCTNVGVHRYYLWGAGIGSGNGICLSNNGRFYIYADAGGSVYRYWWTTNVTANILDGNWYHIMLYIPNSTAPALWNTTTPPTLAQWYVNGVELTNTGSVAWPQGSNEVTAINGFSYWNHSGDCEISNWAYWLSDQRANRGLIYNGGTPGDLLPLGPAVWWKLDADNVTIGSQVDVLDSSGNGVDGDGPFDGPLLHGFPKLVDADVNAAGRSLIPNYSFDFDGIGDYIDVGTIDNQSTLTISAWMNSDDLTATQCIISDGGVSGQGYRLEFGRTDETFSWVHSGAVVSTATASAITTTGTWHNIIAIRTGSTGNWTIAYYVDGVAWGNTTGITTDPDPTPDNTALGSRGNGSGLWFNGKMSNIAMWDSDQTSNIPTIYNNGRPGDLSSFSPAPVSWWKLGNDAFAEVGSPTAWTVPDQIGSNDGTSQGNPTISGEAPGSTDNGLSVSMDIEDRIGESGQSSNNAQSYNMATGARIAYT